MHLCVSILFAINNEKIYKSPFKGHNDKIIMFMI